MRQKIRFRHWKAPSCSHLPSWNLQRRKFYFKIYFSRQPYLAGLCQQSPALPTTSPNKISRFLIQGESTFENSIRHQYRKLGGRKWNEKLCGIVMVQSISTISAIWSTLQISELTGSPISYSALLFNCGWWNYLTPLQVFLLICISWRSYACLITMILREHSWMF